MDKVQHLVKSHPFVISHDNLNIPFRVYSQRIDNQSHFDSGTAATVYFQPDAPPIAPLCNCTLQEYRAAGRLTPLSTSEIFALECEAAPSRHVRDTFRVLRYLIECPEFNFATYSHQDDLVFTPPLPIQQLHSGQAYVTQQYMLGTVHIEEASYEGNDKLLTEWFKQLGLHSDEEQRQTGMERVIPWVGDQLTIERLCGLYKFCAQDHNAFDRMDWIIPVFGWFHLQMAFANSLHKQYLGATAGRGLMHAFTLLERKGLNYVQTKGPFHQSLRDTITHVAKAHNK
ncbi:hypothetical protein SERLA73DRAFT_43910 [Serpula lacrymans var. lacrymans S7.3]|uniref:DUF6589 domain-containing protein n=1 Tax=Serpula lacrymans var. lacrymans (strain S7.3) TaxID=936435 RepID=F8PHQ2_SERL3|nr:hypothetical protein SERLA73DRAFT_43910 [Serpula lacrymans var. lacrymans S7.3]